MPIEGWIVDILGPRRGPKLVVAFGGIMVALGWVINSYALVRVANLIKTATGSWHMVFLATAILNFVVVGLALFVLKPLRQRTMAKG